MDINVFLANFADQFDDTDASVIKAETTFRDLDEWSSLVGLAVLNMCEREYGASISFDELRHAITVQDLFDLIEKKQVNG